MSEFPAPPYLSRSMRHAATPLPLAVANAARSFCFVVLTMIEKSVALSKLHSWSRNACTASISCAARSARRGRSQATKCGSGPGCWQVGAAVVAGLTDWSESVALDADLPNDDDEADSSAHLLAWQAHRQMQQLDVGDGGARIRRADRRGRCLYEVRRADMQGG